MQCLRKEIVLLIIFFLLVSCHSPGTYMGPADMKKPLVSKGRLLYPDFAPITPDHFLYKKPGFKYRVGPQDILTIIVWNHPELTIPSMQTTSESVNIYAHINDANNTPAGILVDEKGEIFFPLAGKVTVNKLTVDQIRVRITNRLVKYIRSPQVSVRVSAFRNKPIYIVGEVVKPGIQYITDIPLTIIDVINQAGGIDKDSSDTHYIYVIRGHIARPQVYWLDASTPGAMLMGIHFRLQSGDIVMVSTAGVARYSRVVNKILPTIQTFMNPPIKTNND